MSFAATQRSVFLSAIAVMNRTVGCSWTSALASAAAADVKIVPMNSYKIFMLPSTELSRMSEIWMTDRYNNDLLCYHNTHMTILLLHCYPQLNRIIVFIWTVKCHKSLLAVEFVCKNRESSRLQDASFKFFIRSF